MSVKQHRWWAFVVVLTDALLVPVAFFVAYVARYRLEWFRTVGEEYFVPFEVFAPSAVALTVILLLFFWIEGIYGPRRQSSWLRDVFVIGRGQTVTAAGLWAGFSTTPF